MVIIGAATVTINGGSAATEWSRLFITNESIQLVATSSTNWQVIIDKRIPCYGLMDRITTSITTNAAGTATIFDWNNTQYSIGDIADLTNDRFNIRRANKYVSFLQYRPYAAVTDQKYVSLSLYKNTTQYGYAVNRASVNGAAMLAAISGYTATFAAGDYAQAKFATEEADRGAVRNDVSGEAGTTWYAIQEIL